VQDKGVTRETRQCGRQGSNKRDKAVYTYINMSVGDKGVQERQGSVGDKGVCKTRECGRQGSNKRDKAVWETRECGRQTTSLVNEMPVCEKRQCLQCERQTTSSV